MAERNQKGRFVKGQSGNPHGRPPRKVEEDYLDVTIRTVSLSDWRTIVKKAVEQAQGGDDKARSWLSKYLLGNPEQKIDLTTAGEPLDFGRAHDLLSRKFDTFVDESG